MTDWLKELDTLPDKKTITATTTAPAAVRPAIQRKCCFWHYKLNPEVLKFTQMGLMTDDPVEAQRQLVKIYGRPVIGLHKKSKK